METLPQVRVIFFFEGDDFDFDDVTTRMKIKPTKARKKADAPIQEIAQAFWSLHTEKESCSAISIQFQKIMNELVGKEEIIKEICDQYNISAGFLINIFMEACYKPEMVLTKEIIDFVSSINAEVGFDLYVD